MRSILTNWFGRGQRIEAKLDAMERRMTENNDAVLAKLTELKAQVDEHTTNEGKRIQDAVAAARAAQASEDKAAAAAAVEAQLAMIEDIGKGLVAFSPSAN